MQLRIITLKGIEFDGEIKSLNLRTVNGEITILDHHRPLITQLSEGKASVVKKDGGELDFDIYSGFLEVAPGNSAVVLAS